MILGPDRVIECPNCQTLARAFTLISGNTFGARMWTDGKMIAPMLPDPPPIHLCGGCSQYYWVERAREIGEFPWGDESDPVDPAWLAAERVEEPTFQGYLEAIEQGISVSEEDEAHLRKLAWWRDNDRYRNLDENLDETEVSDQSERSGQSVDNMRKLLDLLDESEFNQRVMKFELYRQLGEFSEARALLEDIGPDLNPGIFNNFLSLLEEKNDQLVEL